METFLTFIGVNILSFFFHFAAIFISAFNDCGISDFWTAIMIGLIVTGPLTIVYLITFFIIRKRSWFNKTSYIIMSCMVIFCYLCLYVEHFG